MVGLTEAAAGVSEAVDRETPLEPDNSRNLGAVMT